MGLFFTFKYRDPKVNIRALFSETHPFYNLDDLSFNNPWFQNSGSHAEFLGVPADARWGTEFFTPDWEGVLKRGLASLLQRLTELTHENEHQCRCLECFNHKVGDLRRLLLMAQFAITSGEPDNYGFSWSP